MRLQLLLMMMTGLVCCTRVEAQGPIFANGNIAPERVADFCEARVTKAADLCIKGNEDVSNACVVRIEAFLSRGQSAEAQRFADTCKSRIDAQSQRCIGFIETGCEACVSILDGLEADLLADEVEDHCAAEVARVLQSQAAAISSIDAVLP